MSSLTPIQAEITDNNRCEIAMHTDSEESLFTPEEIDACNLIQQRRADLNDGMKQHDLNIPIAAMLLKKGWEQRKVVNFLGFAAEQSEPVAEAVVSVVWERLDRQEAIAIESRLIPLIGNEATAKVRALLGIPAETAAMRKAAEKQERIDLTELKRVEKLPAESLVARKLAQDFWATLAYNSVDKWVYQYEADAPGVWGRLTKEEAGKFIADALHSSQLHQYSSKYLSGVTALLTNQIAVKAWDEAPGLLPLKNGVLKLDSCELLPHAPRFHFTWALPYDYDPAATCEPVKAWMLEAMEGDASKVEVLRAYLKAVVLGMCGLQRYMECIGPGATGKSTFVKLAACLVGKRNMASTDFGRLGKPFEGERLYGKRLIVLNDEARHGGEGIKMLRNLTGEDEIPLERKNIGGSESFTYKGMVLICANQGIQGADMDSAIVRRRITVPFLRVVQPHERRDLESEFDPLMPGVLNWVLAVPDARVREVIGDTDRAVPSLGAAKREMIAETNPMAAWFFEHVEVQEGAVTPVGVAEKLYGNTYEGANARLYASYKQFCDGCGHRATSQNHFSRRLDDLCRHQLKLPKHVRYVAGGGRGGPARFEGMKLRAQEGVFSQRPAHLGVMN